MKPKGEVNYIAVKQRKPLWIAIILLLIFFITLETIICLKSIFEGIRLYRENEDLKSLIETQKSMISYLEENCKDLFIENQNLKFGDD